VNPNEQLINRFYESFSARNAEAMVACYHPDIVFSDPVFGRLAGPQAKDMWRMLCARAKDLAITFHSVSATRDDGSAHWEARYSFGKTGRPVHNVIEACFAFRDGKILRHEDTFSLWKWAAQALGPAGTFLGWTPLVRGAIRKEARRGLEEFLDHPAQAR
jgi:ketosteroid isomerase-like protein